jgi:hypothetical protein
MALSSEVKAFVGALQTVIEETLLDTVSDPGVWYAIPLDPERLGQLIKHEAPGLTPKVPWSRCCII